VLRELREELGLEARVERQLRAALVRRQHLDVCFVCRSEGELVPDSREVLEAGFFPVDRLPEGMADGLEQTIKEALGTRGELDPRAESLEDPAD
jgi:ADP-ribose pyrophosphatase YjhB (NUDIX family)